MKKILLGLSFALTISLFGSTNMSTSDHANVKSQVNEIKKMLPRKMGSNMVMTKANYDQIEKLISFEMLLPHDYKNVPKDIQEELAISLEEDYSNKVCQGSFKQLFGDYNGLKVNYNFVSTDKVFDKNVLVDLQKDCRN